MIIDKKIGDIELLNEIKINKNTSKIEFENLKKFGKIWKYKWIRNI